MALEYIVYADESVAAGKYFSNFYGGCLVESPHLRDIERVLNEKKAALHLFSEVKWQKVTAQYLAKYIELIDLFFDLLADGRVKMRVMFTQNRYVPTTLTAEQREHSYFLLYYQFLKHAFGLAHSEHESPTVRVRLYLDELPDTREKRARFRAYLSALTSFPQFRAAGIIVDELQIAEVRSHDHVLLQCVDVVLGAMQFRLNDRHRDFPPGSRRRGARTIAKEKFYKAILRRVRQLHPGFNPGISTGSAAGASSRWQDPYRHWLFVPAEHDVDPSLSKPKSR